MYRLTLRVPSSIPLEVYGVTPATVANRSAEQVSRMGVRHGNRVGQLGEFFEVTTDPHPGPDLLFVGDLRNVHGIAAGMTGGSVLVEGDVGRHAGAKMTAGKLVVFGAAGDWLGAEMSGGEVLVNGSAGHRVGGAYPGSRHGMRGGCITIVCDAGDELGLLMRRGFIGVLGVAGAFAGASMIAGTLQVNGGTGERLGAGMKRGTILCWQEPKLPPGFVFACEYRPQFLPLYVQGVRLVRCHRGDLVTGGRGEVLHLLS